MPKRNEAINHTDVLTEVRQFLEPGFTSFVLPPFEKIDNLYRYETWTTEYQWGDRPDTIVYRIVHKNHDIFFLILHPKGFNQRKENRFPDLALIILNKRSDLTITDPATGKALEILSLSATDGNGSPTRPHLFGFDYRIDLAELILYNQTHGQRTNQKSLSPDQ